MTSWEMDEQRVMSHKKRKKSEANKGNKQKDPENAATEEGEVRKGKGNEGMGTWNCQRPPLISFFPRSHLHQPKNRKWHHFLSGDSAGGGGDIIIASPFGNRSNGSMATEKPSPQPCFLGNKEASGSPRSRQPRSLLASWATRRLLQQKRSLLEARMVSSTQK